MIIAARFERDRRRANIGWLAGVVAVIVLTAALWPSIEGSASFDEAIEDLPDAIKSLIGAQGGVSLGTPAGYLNARVFATVLPVLVTVYSIGLGARALAGAEDDGTLELILANPVSRLRVAVERVLVAAGSIVALGALALVSLLVLGAAVGLLDGLSLWRLTAACGGVTVLAAFHGAIAFATGAVSGRPSVAVAAAGAIAVAGYLLAGLLATAEGLDWLRSISPWHWLLERNVLAAGAPLLPLVMEVVIAGALVVIGVHRFRRRDLR